MAERNDKTNSTPTNTAGADKTTTTNPTTEANRNAGKEGEMDREGRQPIGKAHTADEHLNGRDDRNHVTNTPKDGTADHKRTDGPTSNTDERHQTGKNTKGNSDGTDRADQKVGGDAARTVAGDDTRKGDKDHAEQPTAGGQSKDKR